MGPTTSKPPILKRHRSVSRDPTLLKRHRYASRDPTLLKRRRSVSRDPTFLKRRRSCLRSKHRIQPRPRRIRRRRRGFMLCVPEHGRGPSGPDCVLRRLRPHGARLLLRPPFVQRRPRRRLVLRTVPSRRSWHALRVVSRE